MSGNRNERSSDKSHTKAHGSLLYKGGGASKPPAGTTLSLKLGKIDLSGGPTSPQGGVRGRSAKASQMQMHAGTNQGKRSPGTAKTMQERAGKDGTAGDDGAPRIATETSEGKAKEDNAARNSWQQAIKRDE